MTHFSVIIIQRKTCFLRKHFAEKNYTILLFESQMKSFGQILFHLNEFQLVSAILGHTVCIKMSEVEYI